MRIYEGIFQIPDDIQKRNKNINIKKKVLLKYIIYQYFELINQAEPNSEK